MKTIFVIIFVGMFVTGCATSPYLAGRTSVGSVPGMYHEVKSGQTLWHISRIYGIELKEIIEANRLPNASKIEVGQLIFVPDARDKIRKETYPKNAKLEGFIWPVKGVVTSYFGSTKNMVKNKGIDIEAREGASIAASQSGKVTFASNHLKGYGKTIIIDHLNGFETVYAHNTQNLISVGQSVKQGQIIAKVGKTGRVGRPTLHFEIRKRYKPQNPFYYLP